MHFTKEVREQWRLGFSALLKGHFGSDGGHWGLNVFFQTQSFFYQDVGIIFNINSIESDTLSKQCFTKKAIYIGK